jgi:Tol biopolymer transport system component
MSEPKKREGPMKKALLVTTALFLVLASSPGALLPQNGHDQFQKALAKERGEGNLEEAIALYQKVIDEAKDEALAAQAQLRIGFCYEKMGRQEAQKAFQKVVDKYPAQTETVKTAREKLALLQKGLMLAAKGSSQPSLRLVWKGPDVELMGAPSPDGRYICYTDWDTGDLAIYDVKTGEKRRLTGQTKWDGSWVENSRWSPDGKLIAYTWDMGVTAELRIVGLDGAKPRVLYQGEGYPSVMDWSPDGRQILTVLYSQGAEQSLSLINVSDGSVRHLKKMVLPVTFSPGRAGYMKFSPDGRHIAFDYPNDIYLISVDGNAERPLVKHPANERLLGWTPDGRSIIFTSDRTGATDAWILPVNDGQAGGEPEIVQKDIGAISPLGFTRDGAFFYGHGKDMQKVYVASIEQKAGALSASYHKLDLAYEGRNHTAEYSPDGKRLAFIRGPVSPKSRSNSLCILSTETREEKNFALDITRVNSLGWAPDGLSIMISGFDEKRTYVALIDTRTGDIRDIFPTDKDPREEMYLSPALSPDGRIVYCVHTARVTTSEPLISIIAKDLSSGRTWDVKKIGAPFALPVISVSPDGGWLAALEHPRGMQAAKEKILKIISTKDGDVRELCRFTSGSNSVGQPRWSTDGRYIFFPGIRAGEEELWDIWYVPIEGGEPKQLGLAVHRLWDICPHPDGNHLAFGSFGPTLHGPEVWVMENFLPAERESKRDRE